MTEQRDLRRSRTTRLAYLGVALAGALIVCAQFELPKYLWFLIGVVSGMLVAFGL
jgi:hypothetical protein